MGNLTDLPIFLKFLLGLEETKTTAHRKLIKRELIKKELQEKFDTYLKATQVALLDIRSSYTFSLIDDFHLRIPLAVTSLKYSFH